MKIICACLNSKYIHSSLAPWCLKAGIDAFCNINYNVKVMESTINSDISEFAEKIISEQPNVLALSCYIWNIELSLELSKYIKNKTACKIVLGGPEVEYCQSDVLYKNPYIDFILSGEGEWSFSSLSDALYYGTDLSCVEGLAYKDNGNIVINPVIEHKETPPSPYCAEYFSSLNNRIAYIEASRGCPYRCAYCLSGNVGKLKLFDIEQVKSNLLTLVNSGSKTIKFIDRTFNANIRHANEILEFIYNNFKNSGTCFHFEFSGDIIKEETFIILEKMPKGLIQLEIGIQSFNEETLSYINRKTDLIRLTQNIDRIINYENIHVHTDLIAGLSLENFDSFRISFNKAFGLHPHMLQPGFLKLLHGSQMSEDKQRYPAVYSQRPPYEIIRNNWLSEDEIQEIKYCESALDKLYNSGRFILTVDFLIKELKLSPFDFFRDFGSKIPVSGMSLKELCEKLYNTYSESCCSQRLKEIICCDLISTKANVRIPDILTSYNINYKKYKKYFSEKYKCNVRLVILDSGSRLYVVSLNSKQDLRKRYTGEYFNQNDIKLL